MLDMNPEREVNSRLSCQIQVRDETRRADRQAAAISDLTAFELGESRDERSTPQRRGRRIEVPLDQIEIWNPDRFRQQHVLAVFRAPAQRSAGALHGRKPAWAVLVGHEVRRHHVCRYAPRHLFVRRRHHDRRSGRRLRAADVHRDGSAETRPAAQNRQRRRGAAEPRRSSKARSANASSRSSMACRARRRSTGSTRCRSN